MESILNVPPVRPVPLDYVPIPGGNLIEMATVRGSAVALATHFHFEDQVTFVVAGRRRFRIGDEEFVLKPGDGLMIKAGVPHRSYDEPDGVECFNAYLRAGGLAEEVIALLTRRWRDQGCLSPQDFVSLTQHRPHRSDTHVDAIASAALVLEPCETLEKVARAASMSREAFSRAFRRSYAMPPSVFRSVQRLNTARNLLRAGLPLAAAAADAGFADQSHLGRCFLRAFGVTPGRYQSAWRRSHPFQTAANAAR